MNKIVKIALAATLMLGLGSVTLNADSTKGQKLYLKKLKGACGMNGAKMAAKHTQAGWEEAKENGLAKEIQKICPTATKKALKDKYMGHYFDFFHNFASDSGNVPSC